VKIIVTGGLTIARIRAFEEEGVPVDAYGMGGAFPEPHIDFAADLIQVDGEPRARAGREARGNPKLEKVK
jgi:nicotinate phosphoribosyltransferase